uniref:Type III effector n=1 Tax=Strongyloides stercoralis TaxID=6248 RepID=A0A0K0EJY9_STRER
MTLPPMRTSKTKLSEKSISHLNFYQTYAFDRKHSSNTLKHSITEVFRNSFTFQKKLTSSSDNLSNNSFYNDVFEEAYNQPLIEGEKKEYEKFGTSYDKLSEDSGVSIHNPKRHYTDDGKHKNQMFDGVFHYELLSPNVAEKLASLCSNSLPLYTVEMGLSMLDIKINKD